MFCAYFVLHNYVFLKLFLRNFTIMSVLRIRIRFYSFTNVYTLCSLFVCVTYFIILNIFNTFKTIWGGGGENRFK